MLSMSMAFTSPPYLLVNSPSGTSRTYSLHDLLLGNQQLQMMALALTGERQFKCNSMLGLGIS